MSQLRDVKFDADDMVEVVEPAQEVMRAFADALFTTIHEARKESGKASEGRAKAYERWEVFTDKALRFLRLTEV